MERHPLRAWIAVVLVPAAMFVFSTGWQGRVVLVGVFKLATTPAAPAACVELRAAADALALDGDLAAARDALNAFSHSPPCALDERCSDDVEGIAAVNDADIVAGLALRLSRGEACPSDDIVERALARFFDPASMF